MDRYYDFSDPSQMDQACEDFPKVVTWATQCVNYKPRKAKKVSGIYVSYNDDSTLRTLRVDFEV